MKKLLLALAVFALISCKEKAPTENKNIIQKEYTLEELENDTNWVEITDIDTIDGACIDLSFFENGLVIRNKKYFDSIKAVSIKKYGEFGGDGFCVNNFDDYNIDTNSKSLIFFVTGTNKGPKTTRKVFENSSQDFLIYYNELEIVSGNEANNIYYDRIIVPKTKEVKFIISKINF